MNTITNLDLLWVGISVAGAGTLGYSIYFSEPKSSTARFFLLFAVIGIFWNLANFASARVTNPENLLWSIRLVIFCAGWLVFSLLLLSIQFPESRSVIEKRTFLALILWTSFVSITTLTSFVYRSAISTNYAISTQTGPGIVIFAVTVLGYVVAAIFNFGLKFLKAKGEQRRQFEFVLSGLSITFVFLVVFELIFPAFLNDPIFVPYGGLFFLPFIVGTAYAILQYRLFNPRVAFFGAMTFILATATFFDVLLSSTFGQVLYRVTELILILIAGMWLLKSMVREFELERELQEINKRQETLIHFIGHEVKGFLTKAEGALAELVEGDFGALSDPAKGFAERALTEARQGVDSVSNILKASNLKKGTVTYTKEPFDMKELVAGVIERAKPAAEKKGLVLSYAAEDAEYQVVGDKEQINTHVLRNLIDNAINYTPSGSITVSLKKENGKVVFAVKDSGVGITEEDKKRLFTEGGHGKDSQTINVHSTGYGLYIAKQVTEAMGGTIHADSEGAGKGSTFVAEFPAE